MSRCRPRRRRSGSSALPALAHIHLVIVHGVQRRRGGRGHPGGAGAGLGVADLGFEHFRHQVRHGPHALADLGFARQAAGQADVDVPVFIGIDPGLLLHGALGRHRPGFHAGVDFVTGAVQEAGVDEYHADLCDADALLRLIVVRRSSSMMPILRVLRACPGIFDAVEQLAGEGDFVGAVHLGLYDVDTALRGVARALSPVQIVQGDHGGEHPSIMPSGFHCPCSRESLVGHQVAHVAHEHQARPGCQSRCRHGGEFAVRIQVAGQVLPPLSETFCRSPRIRPSQLL